MVTTVFTHNHVCMTKAIMINSDMQDVSEYHLRKYNGPFLGVLKFKDSRKLTC